MADLPYETSDVVSSVGYDGTANERLGDFPYGWPGPLRENHDSGFKTVLLEPERRATTGQDDFDAIVFESMDRSAMPLLIDPTTSSTQERNMENYDNASGYNQHRARMVKLRGDYKRLQKLESQAISRLDRIRQMKDQLTDRIQSAQQDFLVQLMANKANSGQLGMDQNDIEFAGNVIHEASVKSEPTSLNTDGTETLDGSTNGYRFNSYISSELGVSPARSDNLAQETYHPNTTGTYSRPGSMSRHGAFQGQSPSILAPLRRKEEPGYRPLSRNAHPQIDDAEATAIILAAKLKGNARHRAGPNYFRRKGQLYADRYYLLEQTDQFGHLIISHDKAVGCFDTARYRYND